MKNKRIAIIHDWLVVSGGAEVVLKYLLQLFPQADIYTLVDRLPSANRDFLKGHMIYTSRLNKYDFVAKKYKYFMPLMPYLIEQFDLSKYDLVISSSHFVAKGVITHPDQLHVSYIYSPVRYAWDLYYEYNRIGALGRGLKNTFMKIWLHKLRIWDFVSAARPDYLIADSKFIAKRILKSWRRDSSVIYPPVEIEDAVFNDLKENYYVTLSRLVEYKRVDILVEAFNKMPDKKLIIIGDGRAKSSLEKIANKNVIFKGYLPKKEAMQIVSLAKAFLFMPKEDFGIVPLEAQACGTPVIAFGEGGALETVLDRKTGLFVKEQNAKSLEEAIVEFENIKIDTHECREFAQNFSPERFKAQISEFLEVIKRKK